MKRGEKVPREILSEGNYSEAAALLFIFYVLIATLRVWARPKPCCAARSPHPTVRPGAIPTSTQGSGAPRAR